MEKKNLYTTTNPGFVKFLRNSQCYFRIIRERPSAFVLLSLVATRARRTNEKGLKYDLEIGEALVGDYSTYGVTRGFYRTDIEYLKRIKAITTRICWRGTIAKLVSADIFDINPKIPDPETTTNKNIKLANKRESILVRDIDDSLPEFSSSSQLAFKGGGSD